jgi:hypothetical protein
MIRQLNPGNATPQARRISLVYLQDVFPCVQHGQRRAAAFCIADTYLHFALRQWFPTELLGIRCAFGSIIHDSFLSEIDKVLH